MSDALPTGRFRTTRWSLVLAAGAEPGEGSRTALEELCRSYWYPIYGFVRRRGHDADRAADLTQEFFAQILEREDLRRADPQRGRFRAWLLTAVRNFLANEWGRETAEKRGGGVAPVSIDAGLAEERYALEPQSAADPERAFMRNWALALLDRVLARLAADYERAGRAELFRALSGTLVAGGQTDAYSAIAARLESTEGAIKVAAHRMRQRYRELLREEIAETLDERGDPDAPDAVEDEIRDLFEALGA